MAKATRLLFVLLLPLMWSLNSWALPADIQASMRLYNIHQRSIAGDVEAMYYLGEVHRLRNMGLTAKVIE